ncbi:MAG: DNA-processing protein DprA [bacterium]|nr:DNA-processing protein DprA [bacterium]
MEDEAKVIIKLSSIKGIGEAKLKEIISRFKPIPKVFDASNFELSNLVDRKFIPAIKNAKKKNVEPELALLKKLNVNLVTFDSPHYPANLKPLPDAPPFLYVRGEILPQDEKAIAIVGSRRATPYGKFVAEKFAYELANEGITIVSGLARGIDTCAHMGALKANGRTIAVFGCGIDIIYPRENIALIQEIISHGACISEFPLGTQPWRGNFPTRNRLISGLSKAVVVIEATVQSGIFSTVEWALNQGREVFAVPGNITSETSKGVNRLIMDGAQPATSPQDILEYLGIKPVTKEKEKLKLDKDEKKVFDILSYEPMHVDNLAEILGIPISKVLGVLLELELRGVVKQLPGRNFVRNIEP